jgi:hypothetical protein
VKFVTERLESRQGNAFRENGAVADDNGSYIGLLQAVMGDVRTNCGSLPLFKIKDSKKE